MVCIAFNDAVFFSRIPEEFEYVVQQSFELHKVGNLVSCSSTTHNQLVGEAVLSDFDYLHSIPFKRTTQDFLPVIRDAPSVATLVSLSNRTCLSHNTSRTS